MKYVLNTENFYPMFSDGQVKHYMKENKNDCRKQVAARLFSNEIYYAFPKGLLKKEEIPLWAGALEIDLDKKYFSGYYELINWVCPAPLLERENPTWGLIVSALRREGLCHI